jgi:integrase
LTLGRYPDLTLDQSRKLARKLLARVLDGHDPVAERKLMRRAPTVADLCFAYVERHSKPHKRSAAADAQRVRVFLVPAWGSRKAQSVRRDDVAALHRKIGSSKGHYTANRLLALVSHIWTWGEREGLLPISHPSPARGVTRFREYPRDRWLAPDEVKRVIDAIEREEDIFVRAYFWLALLTGCRKSELLQAKWEDVDFHHGTLRIPQTKAGRVHYVPLSGPAREVLQALPRESGNPHVLPGRKPGGHLVNVTKPWKRICTSAGVEKARLHDLRRTVGSWLAQSNISLHLIGHVLNQTTQNVTEVYARFAETDALEALEGHGAKLLAITGRTDALAQQLKIGGERRNAR